MPGYARRCSSIHGKAAPSLEDVLEELLWGDMALGRDVVQGAGGGFWGSASPVDVKYRIGSQMSSVCHVEFAV